MIERLSLNGAWKASQVSGEKSKGFVKVAAQVPGCIHTDLMVAGKISEPFYRDNELKLQWIGEVDWEYTRTFQTPATLLRQEHVLLRCEGLDTLAIITVNGTEIARTNNMFRTWEFDVKHALKPGRNTISIRFDSTILYIKDREASRHLPGWNGPQEIAGRAWVRKEPSNYGWDWGPVFITCGIWRNIELMGFDNGRLTGVNIIQHHQADQVKLEVTPECELSIHTELQARVVVSYGSEIVAEGMAPAGKMQSFTITDPHRWWPNNMGEQPLYVVDVTLVDADGNSVHCLSRRIGLRTLVLDRHPDQWGESFQFVVNGLPFFAKGGNWIPADTFVTTMTRERYADLLTSCKDANMNMLRLWGGGIYEQDDFYELCDEMGICIWHDFMFACSAYPGFDKAFLSNVRQEAVDNVRRLRHHPSIALWCGNNELEQGLVGPEWTERTMNWQDYSRIFDQLLPEVTQQLDPQRSYWPSSPHTPHGDRANFNDPTCGDAHLWDVWHGRKPFEWYRTCTHRFNSEFGFQSFPEPKTVREYTEPNDRNVTTYVMELHQRSGIGNAVIMHYMLDWFRLPESFDMTLRLSQILQGMAMKYAVEHWRRAMPRGMGTLYWQINDCWPVASWASIDYYGRWKALHYMARSFYAPVLVSAVEDATTGRVQVHLTNDMLQSSQGQVAWRLTTAQGRLIAHGKQNVSVDAQATAIVATLELGQYVTKYGARELLVWVDYSVKGKTISSNLALFARPKHLDLTDAFIEVQVERLDKSQYAVTLTSDAPALWTWLELEGIDAQFSDNYVHLYPKKAQRIIVTPATTLTLRDVKKVLRVNSLTDTY